MENHEEQQRNKVEEAVGSLRAAGIDAQAVDMTNPAERIGHGLACLLTGVMTRPSMCLTAAAEIAAGSEEGAMAIHAATTGFLFALTLAEGCEHPREVATALLAAVDRLPDEDWQTLRGHYETAKLEAAFNLPAADAD